MTRLDEIIANALAGIPETDVAILAREVVRLRAKLSGAPDSAAWLTIDEIAEVVHLEISDYAKALRSAMAISKASIEKGVRANQGGDHV